MARLRVFDAADAIGSELAERLLGEIRQARETGRRFILGCPTGRTPRPIYSAMARRLSAAPQDLSHVVLVMMDEYLVPGSDGLDYAPPEAPWSCNYFARVEILNRLNEPLAAKLRVPAESLWFPGAANPADHDLRVADAGGIDFFVLASGASDGHVAFNPPGSSRDSRTRIITLSEETRRDNLRTFPAFGTIDAVPKHGVSVGIATITAARAAVMVLTGSEKRESLSRIVEAGGYDPRWPATVIHELESAEIFADRDAATQPGKHRVETAP